MSQEQKSERNSHRTLRVLLRVLILITAMAGVFFASFFVTLAVKTDNPVEIVRGMLSSSEERQRKIAADRERDRSAQRSVTESEPSLDESEERSVRAEEQSSDAEMSEEAVIEPKSEVTTADASRVSGSSWSEKLSRLSSIKSAVNDKLRDRGHYVPLEEIPRSLRQAIVAIEDSRFYSHKGFDPEGIARATVVNVEAGKIEEGASTITQQLVKNLFLTQEQSFTRKVEEILLAINMERNFTKDEILELYLNTIYFGSNFYGVYEAAEGYFGKEPSELTLAESAMLAGLPQAPSVYSPYADFMLAKKRQLMVINAMVKSNILTEREAERARVDSIVLAEDVGD